MPFPKTCRSQPQQFSNLPFIYTALIVVPVITSFQTPCWAAVVSPAEARKISAEIHRTLYLIYPSGTWTLLPAAFKWINYKKIISIYLTLTTFTLVVSLESLHVNIFWISINIKLHTIYTKGYKELLQVQLEQSLQWPRYRPDDWEICVWIPTWGRNVCQKVSRQAWKPIHPPIKSILSNLSSGKKWPRHHADHSPTWSAKAKKACSYTSTTLYSFILWWLSECKESLPSLL